MKKIRGKMSIYPASQDSLPSKGLFTKISARKTLNTAMWVQENAHRKGELNMIAGKFCEWMKNELLPSYVLTSNLPRTISMLAYC